MYVSIEVYRKIREEILWGEINPGERLIENDLSKKFNISRGSIRIAFNYLEKDGYINILPNKGAVVAKITANEIREYYELLSFLEGKSVEMACPNLDNNDIRKLFKINKSMCIPNKEQIQRDEIIRLRNGNLSFHDLLGHKSGNSKVPLLIKDVRKRVFGFKFWLTEIKTYYEHNFEDHIEIISILKKRDCTAARLAMEKHIMKTCKVHLDTLSQI